MATALITGASAGLGTDFARILAGQKYDLILTARNEEKLKSLASELSSNHSVKCHTISADLAKPGSAASLARQIKERGLKVDVLINNAGCGLWGPFADSVPSDMAGMIQLNVNALTELTREFLPGMITRKQGRILNVASTAAFQPGPWMAVYYATKAYVLSFGEALATELKGTGVTVTTLCPGPTKTEFFERANMTQSRLKNMVFADSMSCARNGVDSMHQGRVVERGIAHTGRFAAIEQQMSCARRRLGHAHGGSPCNANGQVRKHAQQQLFLRLLAQGVPADGMDAFAYRVDHVLVSVTLAAPIVSMASGGLSALFWIFPAAFLGSSVTR